MVHKYYKKSLNRPKPGSIRPACPLCRRFLNKDSRSVGVCSECVKLALDPDHLSIALRYFNDLEYVKRLLITKEILEVAANEQRQ